MKSLLARFVLVLVCLMPLGVNAATWYFTVLLKSDVEPERPLVHHRFQHSIDTDKDLFKLMEGLAARPLNFHSADDFSYYVGSVVPNIGFDPLSESISGFLMTFSRGIEDPERILRQLPPHGLLPYLIQAGESIERQFMGMTGISLGSWSYSEFMHYQTTNYGGHEITWPLPLTDSSPFPHINMHQFIQHVLYEMALSKAGFEPPPCFAGLVDHRTANHQACDSLFTDETIAGLNWFHGADSHLLQAFSQILAGSSKEDIRQIITNGSWAQFFDKPTTSFDGLKVIVQLSRGWSPFYQTYVLKTKSNPAMNKPTLINHSLLLGSWSRSLSETDKQGDPSIIRFLTGLKPGSSSVDGAEFDIRALQALENAFRIAYLQDIQHYTQLVFNQEFPRHLHSGISYLDNNLKDISSDAYTSASRFFTQLQALHERWQSHQSPSEELRAQLIQGTLQVMSFEGHFPSWAAVPLIMAKRQQLLDSGAIILRESSKYVISYPAVPSPQQRVYQEKLSRLLAVNQLRLIDVARDGNCMFTALGQMFGMDANTLRLKLIAFLRKLKYKIKANKPLTELEFTYWMQNGYDEAWLSHEFHIMEGGGWGGVHTLGPLIAMIAFEQPETEGLTVILPHGPELVIWQVTPDGAMHEQPQLTHQFPILVQDGINHWMIATENNVIPLHNQTEPTPLDSEVSYTPDFLGRLLGEIML